MPWRDVHGAARGVAYALIGGGDPVLAGQLHEAGWQGRGMRPVGISRPFFAGVKHGQQSYLTSSRGSIWLGSPVPQIAAALLRGVASCSELRWGHLGLVIRGFGIEDAADYREGYAVFTSVSPVVVKHESRFLLPGDGAYLDRLAHNIRHKADLLGLPPDAEAEVLEAGRRRRFEVRGGFRLGADVKVGVRAAPALLDALRDWGLGLDNIQGFGWVR